MQRLQAMMQEMAPRRVKRVRPVQNVVVGEGAGMDSDEEDGAFEEDLVGDLDVGAGAELVDDEAEEMVEGFEDGGLEEDESEDEEDEVWEKE